MPRRSSFSRSNSNTRYHSSITPITAIRAPLQVPSLARSQNTSHSNLALRNYILQSFFRPKRSRQTDHIQSPSNSNILKNSSKIAAGPVPSQQTVKAQPRSSILVDLMDTMFLGMGLASGHEIIRGLLSITGSNNHSQVNQTQHQGPILSCVGEDANLLECLKVDSNDISGCQKYLESLKLCETVYF